MKKLSLIFILSIFLVGCFNDDDDTIALCEKATNISSSDITDTTANITWEDANNASSYILEYGISGFALGTGTVILDIETTATLSNLVANTTYDVYVQVVCSASNVSLSSDVFSFTTLPNPVIAEYRTNLSELNLFTGDLADLNPSIYAFEYDLNSRLFSDYAHKQRFIVLPLGEKLTYDGDGLPLFPENTLIAKTFYYNIDERDESLGKKIIETRILIKQDGNWELGNYKWNESQTDAVLDTDGGDVPTTWIDSDGDTNTITYKIPSSTDCFTCHQINGNATPIGPKLRTLNFSVNGTNQLQALIDSDLLDGVTDPNTVSVLPDWTNDTNYTLEERTRAYLDINCAHCHIEGGYCELQSSLRLGYETSFDDSNIYSQRFQISARIANVIPGFSMPFIGTTIIHDEGVSLIEEYLDTL
ncbi:fibronectin type III domain-containing protein [Ichthyenterobacterium magnum]|uniref:Putative repeat protein (TIGR03806 family) n=1 Tax=Ichthyenterobacterium magnum TaxID=1230530 RepID=A0A420DFV9_9FLAO|nr:fibronectin type III domain-containing protein [Ichthyenterobacterium magnum]RKE92006.1 putative repeat protein (TIGR03806 family) [Ichthyenterobacterium magnum]